MGRLLQRQEGEGQRGTMTDVDGGLCRAPNDRRESRDLECAELLSGSDTAKCLRPIQRFPLPEGAMWPAPLPSFHTGEELSLKELRTACPRDCTVQRWSLSKRALAVLMLFPLFIAPVTPRWERPPSVIYGPQEANSGSI